MRSTHEKVTIIADVHGDHLALRDSLVHAGVAKRIRGGMRVVEDGIIVLTGDLIDRGNSNVAVLDTLLEIGEQTRLELLAGNHELLMFQALRHPNDDAAVLNWVGNGGDTVLREVAKKYNIKHLHPVRDLPWDANVLGERGATRMRRIWDKMMKGRRMDRYDLPAALHKSIEIFLRGKYARVFDSMNVQFQPHPNVLAVHAAINAPWAAHSVEEGNALYRECYGEDQLHLIDGTESTPLSDIFWKRREGGESLLDETTADLLKERSIQLIVHGHDMLREGKQLLWLDHGIAVVNGDTGMSRGYPKCPSGWGYVQIDEKGSVVAQSSQMGRQIFGRVGQERYIFPWE